MTSIQNYFLGEKNKSLVSRISLSTLTVRSCFVINRLNFLFFDQVIISETMDDIACHLLSGRCRLCRGKYVASQFDLLVRQKVFIQYAIMSSLCLCLICQCVYMLSFISWNFPGCGAARNWCGAAISWCGAAISWCGAAINRCSAAINRCGAAINRCRPYKYLHYSPGQKYSRAFQA